MTIKYREDAIDIAKRELELAQKAATTENLRRHIALANAHSLLAASLPWAEEDEEYLNLVRANAVKKYQEEQAKAAEVLAAVGGTFIYIVTITFEDDTEAEAIQELISIGQID